MRHVSRTHRVALDWLFDRINLDPKSKSNTLTPKTNSQTYWQRVISHVTNGTIFWCLFNISHFSSTDCSEVIRKERKKIQVEKESQQNRDQWWIWSREAMKGLHQRHLLLHQKAPGKPNTKVKVLWVRKLRSTIERWDTLFAQKERTDLLYTPTHQATQNGMLIRLGLLKSGNLMNWWKLEQGDLFYSHSTRTDSIVENDNMDSDTEAESEMSLKSRSFLHRVNDQVRKRQYQSSKDATKDSNKHSVIWWMFMSSTLQASVFMGKNYSDNWHSIKNSKDLTMKQMFDIPEKLISEQSDEINGVSTINWENSSWKHISLVGDEQVISLQRTEVYVFSDSVLCLGKIHENPNQTLHGKKDWRGSKDHRNTETWTELMVSQLNSSGISSQDSPHCSSATTSKCYCWDRA